MCLLRSLFLVSIATALAGMGGCADARPPTQPSPPAGPASPGPAPPAPVAPSIVRIVVDGPQSVAPGGRAQYAATAQMADGTSRDVTGEAGWSTSGMPVLSISASGLALAGSERGFAHVEARAGGRLGTKSDVIVVPDGTYMLYGEVRSAGTGVANARIEVVAGVTAPPFTTFLGIYRLFGVAGETRIKVTAEGYESTEQVVSITGHGTRHDFELRPIVPFPDLSGRYRLTVAAASACRDQLPDEARTRSYTAVLTTEGRRVTARLEGAMFHVNPSGSGNRFSGVMEPGRVTFTLHGWYSDEEGFWYPDVFEQLAPTLALNVSGSATVSPAGLSGSLDGVIQTLRQDGPSAFAPLADCQSAGHQFVLARMGS